MNCAWRLGGKYGVAYLEDRKLATEILSIEHCQLRGPGSVMATYFRPTGKPFAWQVRFGIEHWDTVARTLGLEVVTKPSPPARRKTSSGAPVVGRKASSRATRFGTRKKRN